MNTTAHILARTEIADCWTWQGGKTTAGYGLIGWRENGVRITRYTHRLMYEALVGPIPAGLTIDHLCRNKACVNPDHLEAVTMRVNLLRGNSMSARHARATECQRGHPKTSENTYNDPSGSRQCRLCRRLRNVKWEERHKA